MNQNKVKWGIAGLGNIAHRFAADLVNVTANGELVAVASREQSRSDAFAKQYGATSAYGSYQALAEDENVDAIYIATVHPYHKPLVELFLTQGKHVLVEKPAFTNLEDWLEMDELAKNKGLLLAEAMKTVTFPAYRKLKNFLLSRPIKVEHLQAGFGSKQEFDPNSFVYNPALCGGATLDIGVYGLWLYFDLCFSLGYAPLLDASSIRTENRQSKVDEDTVFNFGGEFAANIQASLVRDIPNFARLTGPELDITIEGKWWNPTHIKVRYQDEYFEIVEPARGGGFEFEITHVGDCILSGKKEASWLPMTVTGKVIAFTEGQLAKHGYGYLTRQPNQHNEKCTQKARNL
ncbi:Gfo/Idh/MocA family protein [Vibrio sonorensis]|uniref:Gfo/Idh/MocA family protein n=1 Tax=Vibrio sonorensis TaxID=1004316 RepID=UPI0008DAD925|nr:Gfo/Idh/MocA family oxidoreductase [Vibrio sonorensis]